MKLIPCSKPKRISSLSRSASAGKGILVLGMLTPFCLAMIPSFSTSTTNSRFAASFSTTRRPNLPSSTNTWCPTSTSSKMSSPPATFNAITSRVDLMPCFVATRIRSPVLYEYSLASPSNNSVRISGPFVSRRKPTFLPAISSARLTVAIRSPCSWWSPCEKLKRKVLAPASINLAMFCAEASTSRFSAQYPSSPNFLPPRISTAGPKVATIFTRLFMIYMTPF